MTGLILALTPGVIVAIVAVVALILIVIISSIKIVPQAKAYVIQRLGSYYTTWQTGVHFKMPIIDKIAKQVSPTFRPSR